MPGRPPSSDRQPTRSDVDVAIAVRQTAESEPLEFEAVIWEGEEESRHQVTMSRAAAGWLTQDVHSVEACVEATLRFLLHHEPRDALGRVNIDEIPRHFPDFETELPGYYGRR